MAAPAPNCRVVLGDIEVTFVPDGYLCSVPTNAFPGTDAAFWAAYPEHLDADGYLVMSLGSLLVRSAGRTALVDLGWGPSTRLLGEPSAGRPPARMVGGALLENLAALGVAPEDVDVVCFSHLHRDHTGWVTDPRDDERALFSRATHLLSQAEWEHWRTAELGTGPAPTSPQLEALAGRIGFVADGETVLPGVQVVETAGHTPGHLSFLISSGTERVLVLGDAVHCPVEITEPELEFFADVDRQAAKATRRRIAALLGDGAVTAASAHFNDLVFGRLLPGAGRPTWHFPAEQRLVA